MRAVVRPLQIGAVLMVAAVAGVSGYLFNRANLVPSTTEAAVQKLLLAPFTDLNGEVHRLSQFRGKVLLVNFWATWCTPCREEMPALNRIHQKYQWNGIEVVGIAADNAPKVRNYAAEMKIGYSLLTAGAEGIAISSQLGNLVGALPFTAVLDRNGRMVYSHAGALTEVSIDAVLKPLL